jgi:hypothetical protein
MAYDKLEGKGWKIFLKTFPIGLLQRIAKDIVASITGRSKDDIASKLVENLAKERSCFS